MRKFLVTFLIAAVFSPILAPIAEAGYEADIKRCLDAREKAQAKTIQDYVCPEGQDDVTGGDQGVAYQVILDEEFRKIDKDAASRLRDMQSRSGKDFVAMDRDISDWFDATSEKSEFRDRYMKVCNDFADPKSYLRQMVDSFGSMDKTVSTDSQEQYFAKCQTLTKTKLAAYKNAARLFAEAAVVKSYKEDKSDFVGKLKKEYQNFLMKWMIYIGEMARIKDKWPNKTPKVQK
jgi:hypothetical protein